MEDIRGVEQKAPGGVLSRLHSALGAFTLRLRGGINEQPESVDPEYEHLMCIDALQKSWRASVSPEIVDATDGRLAALASKVGAEVVLEVFAVENKPLWTYNHGRRIRNTVISWMSHTTAAAMQDRRMFSDQEQAVFDALFDRLGLDRGASYDMLSAWLTIDSEEKAQLGEDDNYTVDEAREKALSYLTGTVADNLTAMFSLEERQSGSVRALYQHFGIRNFWRYPSNDLLAQLSLKRDPAQPLSVVISDTDDHNHGLGRGIYETITQLLGEGQAVFMEARRAHEGLRRVVGLSRQLGPITQFVLCAHANEHSIGNDWMKSLTQEQIEGARGLTRLKDAGVLDQNAVAAFVGCLAGGEGGVASTFAKRVGVPTFAFDGKLFGFDESVGSIGSDGSRKLHQSPDDGPTKSVLIQPDGSRHVIGERLQPFSAYRLTSQRVWQGGVE